MSVVGITDLWAYVVGCIAIVLLPGPNSLFVMSTAALAERRSAWAAVLGVLVADTLYIVGSALGLVALLRALPWLFDAMRWIGAAYLGWLGLVLIASAWKRLRSGEERSKVRGYPAGTSWQAVDAAPGVRAKPWSDPEVPEFRARGASAKPGSDPGFRTFHKALAIGLLNPKALMFYVAFFPLFVDPATGSWLTFVVMGTILQLCSVVYLVALVLGGGALAVAARRSTWLAVLGRSATGALFLAFGARLAAARTLS